MSPKTKKTPALSQSQNPCDCGHAKEAHISGYFACYAPGCHCSKYTLPGHRDAQPARLPGSGA